MIRNILLSSTLKFENIRPLYFTTSSVTEPDMLLPLTQIKYYTLSVVPLSTSLCSALNQIAYHGFATS